MEFEEPQTIRVIAAMTNGSVSQEYIRAACHRAEGYHPLPHIESGEKRPVIKIRWSVFCHWFEEEQEQM